jgi:hypothetical protein
MGRGQVHTEFWWRNLREKDYFKDPGTDRRIILKWIFKNWNGDIDWIFLAEYRDRCLAVVNAVMNLRIS